MDFKVSIIVPVYNAERYIEHSVGSCLALPEVGEVLLIDDSSKDGSLAICLRLAEMYNKVRILRHDSAGNKGAAASRNLGLKMANYEYIAFLDADDYYLPNRFKAAKEVFSNHPDADGVYDGATIFKEDGSKNKFYSVSKPIPPEDLFHCLVRGTYGHFHTNAITIKKSLIERSGNFNTTLRLHQDAELFLRLAFHGRLYPGMIDEPVAFVRRHENNRIIHADERSKMLYLSAALDYYLDKPIKRQDYFVLLAKLIRLRESIFARIISAIRLLVRNPLWVRKALIG